ncbi:MAG TPA: hypothetical protein VF189_05320, partial [Patescibacteria group bacterium]
MTRDRLVIHYDRNVNGVATPADITIKRPHALSLRPKHEARAKDSRAIAEALYKADPTLPFFDGANTDRG